MPFGSAENRQRLSRCTQFPELRLFVFNPFPGFNCIVTALKSRTVAPKTRTKFLLKFVRDISTKMTLSFFRASVSVRDLSTNRSTNSGIYVLQTSPPEPLRDRPQPRIRGEKRMGNCSTGPGIFLQAKGNFYSFRNCISHVDSSNRSSGK